MKRLCLLISMLFALFTVVLPTIENKAQAQSAYVDWLGALDTLTNTEATTYNVQISGPKSNVTFQINQIRISGTIAGNILVYGSIDGVNYSTTAVTTVALVNAATQTYVISYANNPYTHWRIKIDHTGTAEMSQRTRLMWRRGPS